MAWYIACVAVINVVNETSGEFPQELITLYLGLAALMKGAYWEETQR